MKDWVRPALVVIVAFAFVTALYNLLSTSSQPLRTPLHTYSRFIADVDKGKVEQVGFQGSTIAGRLKDGQMFETAVPHVQVIPGLTDRLLAKGVIIGFTFPPEEEVPSVASIAASWFPMFVFYGLFYFFFARPGLALSRQVEAYIRLTQERLPGPPLPPS